MHSHWLNSIQLGPKPEMTTLLTCFLVRFESSHDILSKVPSPTHLSYVSWYSLMFPAGGKLLLWGQIPSPSQVSDHKSLRRLWTPHFVPVQGGKVCVFKRDWASVFSAVSWSWILKVFSLNHMCLRTHGLQFECFIPYELSSSIIPQHIFPQQPNSLSGPHKSFTTKCKNKP